MENLEALDGCPLFEGIEREERGALLACLGAREVRAGRGECLLREGERAALMGVVLEGAVLIRRQDYDGRCSIVARAEPGELFGETYACAEAEALPVSAVAEGAVRALMLDCRRITTGCSNACAFHGRMVHNLLRVVAEKNLVLDRKLRILSGRTTRERLMAYLQGEAARQGGGEFVIPYDRQGLADYLEVDRSGLSTEIGKLRREGVIECERNWFRLN